MLPKFYLPRFINEPLGLEYLASAVRKDHEVQIFDSIAEGWNRYRPADDKGGFFYQGVDLKALQKKINSFKPEVIGLTWLFSVQNRPIIETINFVKTNNRNVFLIVGGSHPSANPVQTIRDNLGLDAVVFGEGEATLKELLDKGLKELETIDGLAFKKEGKIIQNKARAFVKNIDDIPPPARDLTPYNKYSKQMFYVFWFNRFKKFGFLGQKNQRRLAFFSSSLPFLEKIYYRLYNWRHEGDLQLPEGDVMTSRGCPNNCIFCAVHIIWKHVWRAHSVERVLEEISRLISQYKLKRINIQDDNFNISKERLIKICQGIVEKGHKITFSASGTYAPALDEEVLQWMQKAGFKNIRLSIESGNQEVLDKIIKKRIDLSKIPALVKMAQKYGMKVEGAFIFGLPGETKKTMRDSVDFAKSAGFDVVKYFIYQPFPNTEAYDVCKEKGYITEEYDPERIFITGNDAYVKTEEFSPEDVLNIARQLDK